MVCELELSKAEPITTAPHRACTQFLRLRGVLCFPEVRTQSCHLFLTEVINEKKVKNICSEGAPKHKGEQAELSKLEQAERRQIMSLPTLGAFKQRLARLSLGLSWPWASPSTARAEEPLSAHLLSPVFGVLFSLPETRLLELLNIELDVLLGDHLAEAGLLWGIHKESSYEKPLVSSPTLWVRCPSSNTSETLHHLSFFHYCSLSPQETWAPGGQCL